MQVDQDVTGKRVTVFGGARSGIAAARLLAAKGASVFLSDSSEVREEVRRLLDAESIPYEDGGHSARSQEADLIVVSPGVPSDAPPVLAARRTGIPIVSEIELAFWYCTTPVVAITGSNGKTTTTNLLGHTFRTADLRTIVGGNVGYPFSEYVRGPQEADVVVLEVSSFQLDEIHAFRPRVSVLLNITPDHLDRYGHDFGTYAASKMRIRENQGHADAFVYNVDDETIRSLLAGADREDQPRSYGFSQEQEVEEGAFVRDDSLVLRINDQEDILMQARELSLRGKHNLYNSLAAAVASRVMEVRSDVVRESLRSFEGVPHRLELVRELDGVRYVNDSKATNVNAVWYALESFAERVVLIAGGRDKGNDYEPLRQLVAQKVRAIVAIGESGDKVVRELGDLIPHAVSAESMEDAVRYARMFAEPGDVVLLSPACASFDMFDNYEHRGDVFRSAVQELD